MRTTICIVLLLAAHAATVAQKVDTIIAYPDKTPEQQAGKVKKWAEERLYFQEFWDGTGAGVFKTPAAGFGTHLSFREVSVRVVGKDSLLLKFRTKENWKTEGITLGRCNATDLPASLLEIRKREGAFSEIGGQTWEPGWLWEIIISWPWDTAFTDRTKPFGFYINFTRQEP